ncbi:2-oxoisovalerate dehydrogenase E1 subunit beta [Pleurocapsa sp. FMAR1]|uniref:2-oxoisovalerate dehydrogenase E1 subunit beta n=1 Tax=Pleurocapsa sp. FMAR1 TaxID=3040204 RepID=UPI0029C6F9F1|nr:2-oxoisovalerate dehydrogenase E1 subunit beta [Pleurocapsa sp. FMAR1]
MIEIVFLVEDDPDEGYTARALGESIFTQADDLESLKEMIRDAVDCHFIEEQKPKVIRLHIVRDEVIAS